MNDPVLDLEISGINVTFTINPQRLRHSLLFSLLSGGNFPTENLNAEIDRIQADIEFLAGIRLIQKNFDDAIHLIRSSSGDDKCVIELSSSFSIKQNIVQDILAIPLQRLCGMDVETLELHLQEYKAFCERSVRNYGN